ncbi:hypothetical protein HK096_002104, partial [Nowakowskiella sp. JEL0078]
MWAWQNHHKLPIESHLSLEKTYQMENYYSPDIKFYQSSNYYHQHPRMSNDGNYINHSQFPMEDNNFFKNPSLNIYSQNQCYAPFTSRERNWQRNNISYDYSIQNQMDTHQARIHGVSNPLDFNVRPFYPHYYNPCNSQPQTQADVFSNQYESYTNTPRIGIARPQQLLASKFSIDGLNSNKELISPMESLRLSEKRRSQGCCPFKNL